MTTESRLNYIDFLRFIGLALIIIAHVQAPDWVNQIRCFDVPLMLFVSGLAYSNKDIKPSCKQYYLPRIKRLLIPTYIFVVCDLIALSCLQKPMTTEDVIKSLFLCCDASVGYVWIIRVFFLLMLVTPFLIKINKKLSSLFFSVLIISLFAFQELLVSISTLINTQPWQSIYQESLPYIIGYSIPFLFGLRLRNSDDNQERFFLTTISIVSLAFFIIYCAHHGFPIAITPFYKYPPHSYFVIYGIFASLILWKSRKWLSQLAENRLFLFIGRNTIWIYLWHIVFVSVFNIVLENWIIKYFLVLLCTLICYGIQYQAVKQIQKKKDYSLLRYFIG